MSNRSMKFATLGLVALVGIAWIASGCGSDDPTQTGGPGTAGSGPSGPSGSGDAVPTAATGPGSVSNPTDPAPATTVGPTVATAVPTSLVATPLSTSATGQPQGSDKAVFQQGDIEAALQPYVDIAVADLAVRLAIEATAIEVHSAVLVIWPDSSLGCPQKGMQYLQVLTDGSVIELAVEGRIYRYHSGGTKQPFLCEVALTTPPQRLSDGGGT